MTESREKLCGNQIQGTVRREVLLKAERQGQETERPFYSGNTGPQQQMLSSEAENISIDSALSMNIDYILRFDPINKAFQIVFISLI